MNKSVWLFLLIVGTILATGCSTTTSRSHPTLPNELQRIDSVVIAPPRVEIEYVTLTGENERLTEREDDIRNQLVEIAKQKLVENGFEVVDFDFNTELQNDENFAYVITQVRDGFDQAKSDLKLGFALSSEKASQIKANVGDAVNIVADKTGSDAILLIRYSGFDKSDGYVAKDVGTSILVGVLTLGAVVPVSATSGAVTEFALVDGTSGEVLWADVRNGGLTADIGTATLASLPQDVDPEIDSTTGSIANTAE